MAMALSDEQIEEQLLNSDLINSGAVQDHANLSGMTTEEKKNLLKGLNQSKEDFSLEGHLKMSPKLDTSGFPSLPTPGRSNSRNKLKLPRKSNSGIKSDTENVSVNTISLLDDDDDVQEKETKFMLPFFVNDDAPPLKMPERAVFERRNPYYVREGEHPEAALKRMIGNHMAWRAGYTNEMRRSQRSKLGLDEDLEEAEDVVEPKNSQVEDIYDFKSNSPLQVTKVYTGTKKKEPLQRSDSDSQGSHKGQQRRSSRDSDCQEVESTVKLEDPKLGDFTLVRQKFKRNRKQFNPGQAMDERPEVSFEFENSWDSQAGAWKPTTSPLNNQPPRTRRFLPKTPVIEEEKVQCPICQRDFGKSKVEAHAATCEGYSGLPMDVEESN